MSKKTKKRKAAASLEGQPRQASEHGARLNSLPIPPARREDIVDVLHGTPVPDPYRWLEDGDSPATRTRVDAQNSRTRQALDARSDRERWHERLVAPCSSLRPRCPSAGATGSSSSSGPPEPSSSG
ncbi:MAG: hypothetical protein R2715_02605 [Ilumatobacteraceae bacterium]